MKGKNQNKEPALLPGIVISEIRFTLSHRDGHQTAPGRLEAI